MKPTAFEYIAPTSLDEALAARSQYADDCAVLAGGQSLVPLLNLRMARPATVIDLGRVRELEGIRASAGHVAIGAMTTHTAVASAPEVRERLPLLPQAIRHIGHPAIRNRGTLGGSLAHADPAAEMPVAAVALDAEIVARNVSGTRTIAAGEFFLGFLTTALAADELIVEVRFPTSTGRVRTAFVELARRHGDYALAGTAVVAVYGSNQELSDLRIVLMAAGGRPVRAEAAESVLRNASAIDGPALEQAARVATADIQPKSDSHGSAAYRRRLAGVLVRRALEEVLG